MKSLPLNPMHGGGRFPGFDVMAQASHWDAATRDLIEERVATGAPLRFFSFLEARTAGDLFDQLLDQQEAPRVPVLELIDARLAKDETDGWRYETMPKDLGRVASFPGGTGRRLGREVWHHISKPRPREPGRANSGGAGIE